MKINLIANGYNKLEEVFKRQLENRISASYSSDGLLVELAVDEALGKKDSYEIRENQGKWVIIGSDETGLFYGIGKFLHSALWCEDAFEPKATNGVISPDCDVRAIYAAVHFGNYYHRASEESLRTYTEELMLWGYNTVVGIVPIITLNENDEEGIIKEYSKLKVMFDAAKAVGMKTGFIINPNQGFMDAPKELKNESLSDLTLRGDLGNNVCLSKPEGFSYMRKIWGRYLSLLEGTELDYILTWPYDECGCGCENCRPWGANKYCEGCKGIREEALKFFPNAKFIVSTWAFDAPNDEGEYSGLYKRLEGDMSWIDYLMVDSHTEFPRYPLEHDVIKPIVNFPEISMWGLYPWGGFGANPLPERFQRLWDSSKRIIHGGMPYSEGIYEDISKIQCVGYYWDKNKNWRDILSEYVNYEYSSFVCDDALELMECIEKNQTLVADKNAPDFKLVDRAKELSDIINECLSQKAKNSWRWRILYIRAQLDFKRYYAYAELLKRDSDALRFVQRWSGELLLDDEEAQNWIKELWGYYFCKPFDGTNGWTLPPYGGTHEETETTIHTDRSIFQDKETVNKM